MAQFIVDQIQALLPLKAGDRVARILPQVRVLDIGAGIGGFLIQLRISAGCWTLHGIECREVCVDLVTDFIRHYSREYPHVNFSGIRVSCGDALEVPQTFSNYHVIFMNNYAFSSELNRKFWTKLNEWVSVGSVVMTTKPLFLTRLRSQMQPGMKIDRLLYLGGFQGPIGGHSWSKSQHAWLHVYMATNTAQ